MVVFAYDLADFTRFYDSLDVGYRGVVSMTGLDGVVRVRSGSTRYFGADVSRSAVFQRILRERQGVYESDSAVDGTARVGYFVTSDRLPLVFLVAYDRAGVLAEGAWNETVMWAGCALLVLLVMAVAVALHREFGRRDRQRKADLDRVVEQRNGALLDAVRSIPGLIVAVASADGRIISSNIATRNQAHDGGGAGRREALIRRAASSEKKLFPLHEVDRFSSAACGECEVIWSVAEIATPPGQHPGAPESNADRFIVLGLDNTEQRQQENKITHMSKLASLGEVATGMAHELNQPLNVIRMAAENALRREETGGDSATYIRSKLNRIVAQTDRAAKIIDHMRIFGRKGDPAAEASHDPWAAVEGALNTLGEQMRVSGIVVTTRGAAGGCRVDCDQALVEQVILNLLLNARDAVEDYRRGCQSDDCRGRIEVSMDLDMGRAAAPRVRLNVSDNGGGVPQDVLPRLFEPFFTTKPVGKGTGLGLSVSYGIIRELGGELSAVNIEGGARFVIDLPCVPAGVSTDAMPAS
jgi:C4-dicarboxylate-specific signal transduction histidine kinase